MRFVGWQKALYPLFFLGLSLVIGDLSLMALGSDASSTRPLNPKGYEESTGLQGLEPLVDFDQEWNCQPAVTSISITKATFYHHEEILELTEPGQKFPFPVSRVVFRFTKLVGNGPNHCYQTRMLGLEGHWSEPSPNAFREFTNLTEGSYCFEVRIVSPKGKLPNPVASFDFVVRSPWYRTPGAYIFFGFMFQLIIFGVSRWQTVSLEKQNIKLQKMMDKQTKELIEVRYLAKANTFKSDFLAKMSHELRNPMNGILGSIALLKQLENDEVKQATLLEHLGYTMGQLKGLFEDLLEVSALEEGRLTLKSSPFRLQNLLASLESVHRVEAEQAGLAIEFVSHADPDVFLEGDMSKIHQILSNLIDNAIKYTRPGHLKYDNQGKVKLGVEFIPMGQSATLRCFVIDNGPGIPPSRQIEIFEEFQRGVFEHQSGPPGMGLGLNIARGLSELMDGVLVLDSSAHDGTVFRFEVSLSVPSRSQLKLKAEENASALRGKRVLLVDDQDYNRFVGEGLLVHLGIKVTTTGSAEEALTILERESFDFVLLDNQMPGLSGVELAKKIRTGSEPMCGIPLVMVSAYVTQKDYAAYGQVGINGVIAKPFTMEQVRETLMRLMGNSEASSLPDMTSFDPDTSGLFGLPLFIADGDSKELKSMVEDVLKKITEQFATCRKAVKLGQWETSNHNSHKALTGARVIGDEELKSLAKTLYEAVLDEDSDKAQSTLDGIDLILRRIRVEAAKL